MEMCFACIAAVLTNHNGWSIGTYKHKNRCVMHEIHVFYRNVWFVVICIKRWAIVQYVIIVKEYMSGFISL